MAFAPGKEAYVTVDGFTKTFDEWTFEKSSDKADVSDYDRVAARWLPGLVVAQVTMSGPYTVEDLGMMEGSEYDVVLGITTTFGLPVTVLVTSIRIKTAVRGVARTEVAGVVNSDFFTDPVIVTL